MPFWMSQKGLFIEQLISALLLFVYLLGFMDISSSDMTSTTFNLSNLTEKEINIRQDLSGWSQKPHVDKVVLVVIDALRADHLFGDDLSSMKYSHSLLDSGSALGYLVQTSTPTVTMPRIKSLVTGAIPGFIDVILNFASSALTDDNIVQLWFEKGRIIHFYGDDTWLKLFPNAFHEYDTVTSFFVADFTEVDDNVTFHLNQQLFDSKWDVLILHYLGLDHIGHLEGPQSHLIAPKLEEMDDIIEKIHRSLLEKKESYVIVVCGDHGMSDAGGHGGASYSEIMTSALVISSILEESTMNNFKRRRPPLVHQVDLVSTFSILSGVKIPRKNVGSPFIDVLEHLSSEEEITSLYAVSSQLMRLAMEYNMIERNDYASRVYSEAIHLHSQLLKGEFINKKSTQENIKSVIGLYIDCQRTLSSILLEKRHSYDLMLIYASTVALVMMWLPSMLSKIFPPDQISELLKLKFLSIFILSVLVLKLLCPNISFLLLILISIAVIKGIHLLHEALLNRSFLEIRRFSISYLRIFTSLVFILHPLSLLASSFVEEEHQFFYFMVSICHFLFMLDALYCFIANNGTRNSQLDSGMPHIEGFLRSCHRSGMTLILASWIIFRVMRSCNATGDKWKHLKDLNDLMKECGPFGLRLSALVGLLLTFYLLNQYGFILVFFTLVFIFLRHSFDSNQPKLGLVESQVAYGLICLLFIKGLAKEWFRQKRKERCKDTSKSIFNYLVACLSLLFLLLQRHDNILLTALSFLQFRLFSSFLMMECYSNSAPLLIYWLSQAHYFIQGNSNSLTTVQVNSGFVGLTTYSPIIHGILIAFHTFGSRILVLLHFVSISSSYSHFRRLSVLRDWWLMQLSVICIYVINVAFQLHHLFIWSVFAPKLLYEGSHLLCLLLVSLLCHLMPDL